MTPSSNSQLSPQDLTLQVSNRNKSRSSLASTPDAATFQSANNEHMELQVMTQNNSRPLSPVKTAHVPPSNLSSTRVSRHDSGYSDTPTSRKSSSRRTSLSMNTSRRSSPSKSQRRTSSVSRPVNRRATRSSPQAAQIRVSRDGTRPDFQTRNTTPYTHSGSCQFFQFPSLADPSTAVESDTVAVTPLPPATVQYWTSDSTRRLEYAAIDAASRGMKGFMLKLVPDCILPRGNRSADRSRFCEGDEGSEAGSVRRYRLHLPEDKEARLREGQRNRPRAGLLRRWTIGFGGRGVDPRRT